MLEGSRSRCTKEEVQLEREQKKSRKEMEAKKKVQAEAWREAGEAYIAQLEDTAAETEKDPPCHRSATEGSTTPVIPNGHLTFLHS
jgi:hypothetical protein